MTSIRSLPTEVLLQIFEYLDLSNLLRAEQVSRAWLLAIRDSLPIWKRQFRLLKYQESPRLWREIGKLISPDCLEVKLYRQSVVVYGLLTEALSEKSEMDRRLRRDIGFG